MKFVKTEDLKEGMRLARPLYNRSGVLLFDQGSKLNSHTISNITNFRLIGVYILEPAEPIPPMSEEDIAFEKFQAEYVSRLQDEMEYMLRTGRSSKLHFIIDMLVKNYGYKEGKIQFIQSLRSREDYVFKHCLNTGILATMICYRMKLKIEDCEDIITAALLHDIGKLMAMKEKTNSEQVLDLEFMPQFESRGHDLIEQVFSGKPAVRRICRQTFTCRQDYLSGKPITVKQVIGSKILMVADCYDTMTAMQLQKEPESEISCVKQMLKHEDAFDPEVVKAFLSSINIVFPGISVELNTGNKALVLNENPVNILRPTVLVFKDNSILDMSLSENKYVEIVDIMKTLDNRYVIGDPKKN